MKFFVVCSLLMCARGLRVDGGQSLPQDKFLCKFNGASESALNEYDRLFKKWSGKTIMFMGDSMLFQTFNLLRCGAGALGMKHDVEEMSVYYKSRTSADGFDRRPVAAEHLPFEEINGDLMFEGEGAFEGETVLSVLTKVVVRPHGESSTDDAVVLYMYFFYKVNLAYHDEKLDYRESGSLAPAVSDGKHFFKTKPSALIDAVSSFPVDHVFTNLGHHGLLLPKELASDIDGLFRVFNAALVAAEGNRHERPTFTLLNHPPQHFNNQNGQYELGKVNQSQPCSNDLPNIREQGPMQSNRFIQWKAAEYGHGFAFIDFFETMIPFGSMHFPEYADCTHYVLSPKVWAGLIEHLVNA